MSVDKDTLIGDIVRMDQGLVMILMNAGMGCVGCPSAQAETLEQACMVHGMRGDSLVDEMNTYLASK